MQRVWAVVLSVWAMLAIVAVLAWSHRPARARDAAGRAQTLVVKGANGKQQLVVVQPGAARRAARDDVDLGGGAAMTAPARASRVPRRRHDVRRGRDRGGPRRRAGAPAAPSPRPRPRSPPARRALSRFDPASDLSPAERRRRRVDRGRPRGSSRRCGSRSARARTPAAASTRPCSPRSSRPATTARSSELVERPAATRGRLARRRGDRDRRARPAACGSSAAPPSTSAASARATRPRGRSTRCSDAWPRLPGGLVDLGGDLALRGETPEGGPWRIAIADPRTPGRDRRRARSSHGGGVATSGATSAASVPAASLHHLIDPATGAAGRRRARSRSPSSRPTPPRRKAHATALAISRPRGRGGARRRAPAGLRALRPARRRAGRRSARCRSREAAHRREGRLMRDAARSPGSIARAAGLVAFGLLTLSVWLGLAMSTRLLGPKRQKPLLGLHRTLVWTGLSMIGLPRRRAPARPGPALRRSRGARPVRRAVEAGRDRDRRHRRLAQPHARRRRSGCGNGSARRAGGDCTTRASAPSRSRSGTRCYVGTDLKGLGGPMLALARRRAGALAHLLPAAHAAERTPATSGVSGNPIAGIGKEVPQDRSKHTCSRNGRKAGAAPRAAPASSEVGAQFLTTTVTVLEPVLPARS